MNALVNDQVDRLYSWLEGQAQVSLFHFTSETMEDKRRADAQDVPQWKRCRMRTRQQARGLESHDGERLTKRSAANSRHSHHQLFHAGIYALPAPGLGLLWSRTARRRAGRSALVHRHPCRRDYVAAPSVAPSLRLRSEDVLQVATSATLGNSDNEELKRLCVHGLQQARRNGPRIYRRSGQGPHERPVPPRRLSQLPQALSAASGLDGPAIVEDPNGRRELAVNQSGCEKLRSSLAALVSAKHLQLWTLTKTVRRCCYTKAWQPLRLSTGWKKSSGTGNTFP